MRLSRGCLVATGVTLVFSCGARTELPPARLDAGAQAGEAGETGQAGQGVGGAGAAGAGGEGGSPLCVTSLDCPAADLCARTACVQGMCAPLSPLDCADDDPCTTDECDPASGSCVHEAAEDADHDGHFSLGDTEACGDDCDDDDPNTYPGAKELCDGKDNDCNSIIDDGTAIGYSNFEPVRVSGDDLSRAGRGGIALGGTTLGVTYTGLSSSRWRNYFDVLSPTGMILKGPVLVTEVNADSYAGLVAWSGTVHGTAWSDARQDGNYEIYFNLFSSEAEKLTPDLRLSDAPDFSLHPALISLEEGFAVAWDDRRFEDTGGAASQIYGRLLAEDGTAASELTLTPETELAEYPSLALGESRLGLVYTVLEGPQILGHFRTFDRSLTDPSPVVDLGGSDVQDPSVVYVGGRFIVAFQTYDLGPGNAIQMAVISEDGIVVKAAAPVTSGASFARSLSMVSFGDRFVLVWADDHDGNYELYSQVMDADLTVLRARQRITFDDADSLWPIATLLPDGGIGILFDDWKTGPRHVYYTRLDCSPN